MYNLDFIMSVVGVLLSVAFFTLMERKILGLAHYRKGPNKVIIFGLSQPISDAVKLLTKENSKLPMTKMLMFITGPALGLFLMFMAWIFFEYNFQVMSSSLKVMLILSIMGLMSFSFLFMSWGSNSKYSMIGGHRAVAQVLSYEVCMFLFILIVVLMSYSLNFKDMENIQNGYWMMIFSLPTFFMWITLCMAESNRTPFDMAEGESEIVSGFNIEYGGGLFALIFITEYGMIIVLSFLTTILFMSGKMIILKTILMCFIYVWVRVSFPRVRYDKLMMMSWKIMLPYAVFLIIISLWVV